MMGWKTRKYDGVDFEVFQVGYYELMVFKDFGHWVAAIYSNHTGDCHLVYNSILDNVKFDSMDEAKKAGAIEFRKIIRREYNAYKQYLGK